MSILIKGMEMPTSCEKCRFSGFGGLRNERVVCMFTGANAYMNEVQYLDDCPLIHVPPHGRLIDADALEVHDGWLRDSKYFSQDSTHTHITFAYSNDIITAPTILEAEVEE